MEDLEVTTGLLKMTGLELTASLEVTTGLLKMTGLEITTGLLKMTVYTNHM